jgi:glutathione peroxidase-family protein
MKTIYDFEAIDSKGVVVDFSQFKGKVLLIVNTASKCGFTPQYAGLELLHKKYKDQGLVIIGFPCNQFLHQEPGDDSDIRSFCKLNYGVSFTLMKKVNVNGKDAHAIYKYLRSKTGGFLGSRIKWNFTKFLISKEGNLIKRYSPLVQPQNMEKEIERLLQG